ncbi:MAG: DUF1501 domain-containing protein [Burkholderiaceae bacterium]
MNLDARRQFIRQMLVSGGALATGAFPLVSLAKGHSEKRLVIVLLRGGLDSLHAIVPYGDPDYYRLRQKTAVPGPEEHNGVLKIDNLFALHPALTHLHAAYGRSDLLLVPASGTSYRRRSHFDAQNQLENGSHQPFGARDGWLNRALSSIGPTAASGQRLGLAVGSALPLILHGQASVRSWSPTSLPVAGDDFLARLLTSYEADPMMQQLLQEAVSDRLMMGKTDGKKVRRSKLTDLTRVAGKMLASPSGPRIAVFESHNWDTHTRQPPRLAQRLGELSAGLLTLQSSLGPAWSETAVLVVSEFGRSLKENGGQGTDHGTGGMAMLLGGAVNGGKVIGQWPGLAQDQRFEGRDLHITTPYEGLFKGLLKEHLGMSDASLDEQVFPAHRSVPALTGLIKT